MAFNHCSEQDRTEIKRANLGLALFILGGFEVILAKEVITLTTTSITHFMFMRVLLAQLELLPPIQS
ncbi:hypothetical protein AKJ18_27710, partial [Vibrio xuii]